jgi:hypothetical protein
MSKNNKFSLRKEIEKTLTEIAEECERRGNTLDELASHTEYYSPELSSLIKGVVLDLKDFSFQLDDKRREAMEVEV